MTREKHNVWPWKERLAALRQLPPVLNIVWQSGPTVVFLGIVFRIVTALLPIGMLAISKLIIDKIVSVLGSTGPVVAGRS
jgi:ATP-binding cassette subfamily B protein